MTRHGLTKGWYFRQSPNEGLVSLQPDQVTLYTKEAVDFESIPEVPTEVHVELLRQGKIPDPFVGDNEDRVQWVGEESWLFRLELQDYAISAHQRAELVFDGLDTFAHVWLDEHLILESDNAFLCDQRTDVTSILKKAGNHVLLIQFLSAALRGRVVASDSSFKPVVWNGEPGRVFVRKPQYHWGWDWGPTLISSGITGSVWLEISDVRIKKFFPRAEHQDMADGADVLADLELEGNLPSVANVFIRVTNPEGKASVIEADLGSLDASNSAVRVAGHIEHPQLWWPVHLGTQPMYDVEAFALDQYGRVLATETKRIGIRRVRVVQKPLLHTSGESFYLEINGVPLFAGGCNWIPLDSFNSRVASDRLRRWLEMVKEGNQNILRIWGGGFYASDELLDICDELGILIWQDFTFACGLYPADAEFCASVAREAEANLLRLRHHACLAVLAGGNEDYQVAESYGWYKSTGEYDRDRFPAIKIYEDILPDLVQRLTHGLTYYQPSSPWTGGNTRDPQRGDNHQWSVWHGEMLPYQKWPELTARFISEWGSKANLQALVSPEIEHAAVQAYPNTRTIDHWLSDSNKDRFPQSRSVQQHQKAAGGERRLALYIEENFRYASDLHSTVYVSQLLQSECVRSAVQTWRRGFKGPGQHECAGSLYWQLNDCYPTISWSLIDCFERPKAAYYTMKRGLAPLAVGCLRSRIRIYADELTRAHFRDETNLSIWISNITRKSFSRLQLKVDVFDYRNNTRLAQEIVDIHVDAVSCLELDPIRLEGKSADNSIVGLTLIERDTRKVVYRTVDWPEPLKYICFPSESETNLTVDIDNERSMLRVCARRPVKGLIFNLHDEGLRLSDNAIDLLPDDEQLIPFIGHLRREALSWRHLGDRYCSRE